MHKAKHICQLWYSLILSGIGLVGLFTILGGRQVNTAAAQTTTCQATIDGITVFSDTTAIPVQAAVNAAADNDLIKVAGTCIGVNNQGGNAQTVLISKSVTIEGGYNPTDWNAVPDPILNPTILDADGAGRVVLIPNLGAFTVTLSNLHLTNGAATSFSGGGVGIAGSDHDVTIQNTQIYSNTSANFGGGMRIFGGQVTIQNSQIYSNTSQNDGGGISIESDGTLTMDNVQLFGNISGDEGGGVHVVNGTAVIDNSAILDNFADDDGGGLDIESSGTATVTNSMIDRNIADDDGGGIEANGNLWLLNSSLNDNRAGDRAALDGDGSAGIIVIHGTTISGNITADSGGSVDFDEDTMVHISDSLIQNNQVLDAGGGGY